LATLVVLAVVLVATSLTSRGAAVRPAIREGYLPDCGSVWDNSFRRGYLCAGETSGAMPAIEDVFTAGNGLCCGVLGIPP